MSHNRQARGHLKIDGVTSNKQIQFGQTGKEALKETTRGCALKLLF